MVRTGQISSSAETVNDARENLAQMIDKAFGTDYLAREQFLEALECFINAKINANIDDR